ncbi:MAG: ROK family protein [Oscillospiraceae bacterium]|jgi:glucokinase|nr:ROK family protein [Oscillospiraceae bacterium]
MYVGVDVGGTNLAAGLVTPDGQILTRAARPTAPDRPPEAIVADIAALIGELAGARQDIRAVGVGIPGLVDSAAGRVIYTPNLPFADLPLAAMLGQSADRPIFLCNDANAAAFGEYAAGGGQNARALVMVTLGTGIGGGLVFDGKILEGVGGAGGEIGHMVVRRDGRPCSCGRRGCWEAYASATALIRATRAAMDAHPDSLMWPEGHGDPPRVSGRTAFAAAARGDAAAQEVVDGYLDWLAEGVANLVNIFDPDVICVGGGVSGEGDRLILPLRERVAALAYAADGRSPALRAQIRKAQLGNDAGLIGAALRATEDR